MEVFINFILDIQQYVVPAIFAIGAIFLLYGIANSFLLDRPDFGHPALLRSCLFFTVAIILYGVMWCVLWLFAAYENVTTSPRAPEVGGEINRSRGVLPTPNAPDSNQ